MIIPVKSFRMGKQRLSDALDPARRERLGRALAGHVAAAVARAGLIPLIVTADAGVAEWATSAGFPSLPDPGDGLDAAAHAGVEWAERAGSTWIVIHSDLPLLTRNDVSDLVDASAAGHSPIAPSADGGTSAIGSLGPFDFSFGVSSFHRHLPRLSSPKVVSRRGLALDIDSPMDLEAAVRASGGAWLEAVLR